MLAPEMTEEFAVTKKSATRHARNDGSKIPQFLLYSRAAREHVRQKQRARARARERGRERERERERKGGMGIACGRGSS